MNDLKICRICFKEKPKSDFGKYKKMSDGLRTECKECRNAYERNLRTKNPQFRERQYNNHAAWVKNNRDKLNAYQRQRAKSDPRIGRESSLQRYHMTIEDYDKKFQEQDNKCWICGSKNNIQKTQKHYHVDHNHETGQIRGILCNKCNKGLGMFNDNIELLANSIMYLQYWKEQPIGKIIKYHNKSENQKK